MAAAAAGRGSVRGRVPASRRERTGPAPHRSAASRAKPCSIVTALFSREVDALGIGLARLVALLVSLFAGTSFAVAGSLATGAGLAAMAVASVGPARGWPAALHRAGIVAAALGSVALAGGIGFFTGYWGLVASGVAVWIAALTLQAQRRISPFAGACFAAAGTALAAAGTVLALEVAGLVKTGPLGLWGVALAVGLIAAAARLLRRPAVGSALPGLSHPWAARAAVAAVALLALGGARLAGLPLDRSAAALEARLQGQPPAHLPGRGWFYFSDVGGPRFVSSRVVVVPAVRDAAGTCHNGVAGAAARTPPPRAPYAVREIGFNPATCQVALREGDTVP